MRILIASVAILSAALQGAATAEPRVVRIVAERFTFTPSRIELVAGESVELVVKSDDTSHGLRIEAAGIDTVVPKRGSGDVRAMVKIDTPGRYPFECSRVCGAGHDFMRGEIIVRPSDQGAAQ